MRYPYGCTYIFSMFIFILGLKRLLSTNVFSLQLGQIISIRMSTGDDFRLRRTSAKRTFTRAANKLRNAMSKECNAEIVEAKYQELKTRMCDVEVAHENYLMSAYPDSEPLETEEEWLAKIQDAFDDVEEIKLHKVRDGIEASEVNIESEVTAKQRKTERIIELEKQAFLESWDNLYMILKHKDATTQVIKDAHVELKAQFDQCKEVQRELVTLVDSTELSTMTKWLSDLKLQLTSTSLDVGRVIEARSKKPEKEASSCILKLERMKMPIFNGNVRDKV